MWLSAHRQNGQNYLMNKHLKCSSLCLPLFCIELLEKRLRGTQGFLIIQTCDYFRHDSPHRNVRFPKSLADYKGKEKEVKNNGEARPEPSEKTPQ